MPTFFICEHINIQGHERSVKKNIRGMFFSDDRRILQDTNKKISLLSCKIQEEKSLFLRQKERKPNPRFAFFFIFIASQQNS